MIALLVPALKTRGYTSLPVHFLGKAATFCLLYAFPLVLLGLRRGRSAELAWVLGWAFAIWGTGLYWYAGLLYLGQTLTLLRTMPRRPAAARAGHVRHSMATPTRPPEAARRPPADASMDLLNQIIRQPLDPDYAVVAARPAAASGPLDLRRGRVADRRHVRGGRAADHPVGARTAGRAQRADQAGEGRRSAIRTDCAAGRPT